MAKEPRPKGYPKLKNYKPSQFMLPTSHYDKKKADRAVTFIENLCHTKGKWAGTPFWLLPWQEQLIRDIFGIVKPDGNRQFRTAFVEICKKVGKSELAAAVALYLLYADNEPSAEVYGAAADRQQASIVFDVAKQMVEMSPALMKRSKLMGATKRIVNYSNAGYYQVLSAEVGGKHGFSVSGLVFDEIHTQPNRQLYDVLTKGSSDARQNPDPFGARRIDKIRLSDAKEWLIRLQQVDKKSYSTIHSIRGVVRPAFQMAVDDDILRKNPFEFQLATVVVNDAVTREAITRKQERTFLDFIKNDTHYSKYYDGMYILFKTGMRISEFTGLTVKDLDMENRTINIDHQLQKTGTLVYIDTTKTYAGTRVIPMQDDVYECFQRILKNRRPPKVEPMIDGYSGFLCFDKDGKPMVAMHWEKYFQHAVDKYNSIYRVQLSKITPHVCRHTYCSNMAKSGMNPKVLQYLMGHSDISVTLNTYTHLKLDDAREEVEKLAKKQAEAENEFRQLGMKENKVKFKKMG